jgi:pyruvate dehydrogenase E1 component
MVALIGDAELDEGNIYEALQEGWKHDLRNVWWVIDYNRQSLDGVVREGLWARIEAIFGALAGASCGSSTGAPARGLRRAGGERLRDWIDRCPNPLYAALTFQGGAAWRKRLLDDLGDQGEVSALLARRSDEELARLMENLGATACPLCARPSTRSRTTGRRCSGLYDQGWGTPLAGHKDNHAGLMTPAQMAAFQAAMGVPEGQEWEPSPAWGMPRGCAHS